MAARAGNQQQQQQQQQQQRTRPYKCVFIGDATVGKTCLVMRLVGKNPDFKSYVPTIIENTNISEHYRGQICKMEMCDTAGQEEYKSLREASYSSVDVFLLCFSLVENDSFENLEAVWMSELHQHRRNSSAKVLLVGTKLDLRDSADHGQSRTSASREEIDAFMSRHNLRDYVECSALTNQGVNDVLQRTMGLLMGDAAARTRKSKRCDVL